MVNSQALEFPNSRPIYRVVQYLPEEAVMRFDKFTTKLQQALSDAQSLAVGQDNQFIEPQHLLLALLNDADSGAGSLLARAGGNVGGVKPAPHGAGARVPQ